MAKNLSPSKAKQALQRARDRAARMRKQTERATEQFVQTAEAGAAAFAVGVTHGKFGGLQVGGIPAELIGGVALSIGGVIGAAGRQSHHLSGIGTGLLAAYATNLGRGVGIEMAENDGRGVSGTRKRMIGAQRELPREREPEPESANLTHYARERAKQSA